jgi:glyoxylase-like metal-dependent hydrolase (beta-lactamase superfamily II)
MYVKAFTFNPFQENTYLIYDETLEALIIDAGCIFDQEKQALLQYINEYHLELKRVINTHLHLDHQFGNRFLFDNFGIKPEAGAEDEFLLENVVAQARSFGFQMEEEAQPLGAYIIENQEIKFGNTVLKSLHVPGHSPGSFAFYSEKENVIFVGDVLFKDSIGRTDLVKGDYKTLRLSIKNQLLPLPDSVIVYSGHGSSTTIGDEKRNNPYLQI